MFSSRIDRCSSPAPGDAELLRVVALLHPQGHVVDQLPLQAFLELAGGQVFAAAPGEGGAVDLEGHAHRGLVHRQWRQGLRVVRVAEGIGDVGRLDPRDGDDVAGAGLLHLHTVQSHVTEDLTDLAAVDVPVAGDLHHRLIAPHGTAGDAPHGDGPDVARIVQRRDLHLEGPVRVHGRARGVLDDGLEEGLHVALAHRVVQPSVAAQGRGVDDGEVELVVAGPQAIEEVEDLVDDPGGPRPVPVDLVDHHDGPQPMIEGLLGDEAGLGHGPLHCIHQQQHRIDHGQDALDLAAEVRVPWGIDDVDAVVAPADRGVLREDGDAALPFDVIGVHDPFHRTETIAEGPRLLQELVYQGRLAVVDMGDDGDVAQVFDHRLGLRFGKGWGSPTRDRPCTKGRGAGIGATGRLWVGLQSEPATARPRAAVSSSSPTRRAHRSPPGEGRAV